ncbi:hypothetical protein D5086_030507 [Populus alba]|uniref:Uncharacterized protein n=1 Tax=Populus alba TaxID=43335 RepID=A0ACC4APA6_POPAL
MPNGKPSFFTFPTAVFFTCINSEWSAIPAGENPFQCGCRACSLPRNPAFLIGKRFCSKLTEQLFRIRNAESYDSSIACHFHSTVVNPPHEYGSSKLFLFILAILHVSATGAHGREQSAGAEKSQILFLNDTNLAGEQIRSTGA